MEDIFGRSLSGYVIEEPIGLGGMAYVFRARQVNLDRDCALKILRPELIYDKRFVERFLREARAAASLNHPNIVTIFDTGEFGGRYFIAMEFIDGMTLRDVLQQRSPDLATINGYIQQIADALDYAHSQGIIHRDIKPGNIIVSERGRIKITDFGIARTVGDPRLTMTGALVGTPTYMAPEQIQGQPAIPQTDIYQLGVTTYEMLTGAPPFDTDSPHAVLYAHFQESPALVHERVASIDPQISNVISKSLRKIPAERQTTASEFANEFTLATRPSIEIDQRALVASTPAPSVDRAPATVQVHGDDGDDGGVRDAGFVADDGSGKRWIWLLASLTVVLAIAAVLVVVAFVMMRDGEEEMVGDVAESGVPALGEIIRQSDADDWYTSSWEYLSTFPEGESIHIQVNKSDEFTWEQPWDDEIGNASYSVDVRMIENSEGAQDGCLAIRVDPEYNYRYSYTLCLNDSGETFAAYEGFDEEGEYFQDVILDYEARPNTNPATEWNTLEIVARGDRFWYLVNGELIGESTNDQVSDGAIAFVVYNYTGSVGEFAFQNLNVREIE